MSDGIKPVALPDRYRRHDPVAPMTVGTMAVGTRGFIDATAIRIDREWGVWVDPDEEVKFDDSHGMSNPPAPIRVDRQEGGYRLHLMRHINNSNRMLVKNDSVEKFKGFIPVAKID